MRSFDTSPDAHAFQVAAYRRMTIAQKADLIVEVSEAAREASRGGIRMRHPEYSEPQVDRALFVLLHGRELAERIWPTEEIPSP